MTEEYIYKCIARYDFRIQMIPREDVMQEIRYALLVAKDKEAIRLASRMLMRLLKDFGYGCRDNRKEICLESFVIPETEPDGEDSRLELIFDLYVTKGYSARRVCEYFHVPYSRSIQDLFGQAICKRELRKLPQTWGGITKQHIRITV
jgi:hypothetical protein